MILADFSLLVRSRRRDSSDFFLNSTSPIWRRVKRSLMKKVMSSLFDVGGGSDKTIAFC